MGVGEVPAVGDEEILVAVGGAVVGDADVAVTGAGVAEPVVVV